MARAATSGAVTAATCISMVSFFTVAATVALNRRSGRGSCRKGAISRHAVASAQTCQVSFDPLQLPAAVGGEGSTTCKDADIKHAHLAMLAAMGYFVPGSFKLPEYLASSLGLMLSDVPPAPAGLASGRMAMVAAASFFYQDGVPGCSWGDCVLRTLSPLRAGDSEESNSLRVLVKNATNLKDADGVFGGGTDAYVKIRVVDNDGNTIAGPLETSTIEECGANPEWNEELTFEDLDTPAAYTLRVTVLDKDSVAGIDVLDVFAADDKLGKAEIDLGTIDNSEEWQDFELIVVDGWFSDSTVNISLNTDGQWGN